MALKLASAINSLGWFLLVSVGYWLLALALIELITPNSWKSRQQLQEVFAGFYLFLFAGFIFYWLIIAPEERRNKREHAEREAKREAKMVGVTDRLKATEHEATTRVESAVSGDIEDFIAKTKEFEARVQVRLPIFLRSLDQMQQEYRQTEGSPILTRLLALDFVHTSMASLIQDVKLSERARDIVDTWRATEEQRIISSANGQA